MMSDGISASGWSPSLAHSSDSRQSSVNLLGLIYCRQQSCYSCLLFLCKSADSKALFNLQYIFVKTKKQHFQFIHIHGTFNQGFRLESQKRTVQTKCMRKEELCELRFIFLDLCLYYKLEVLELYQPSFAANNVDFYSFRPTCC